MHPLIDRAIAHVREQGEPAYSNGECQLLTTQGLRCAVGGLINPRDVTDSMEAAAVPACHEAHQIRQVIQKNNPDLDLPVDDCNDPLWDMLSSVQEAHDWAAKQSSGDDFLERFENNLREYEVIT